jgi:hypothetical protein
MLREVNHRLREELEERENYIATTLRDVKIQAQNFERRVDSFDEQLRRFQSSSRRG